MCALRSVVTRSASRVASKAAGADSSALPPLAGLPDSIPHRQLIDMQQADSTLQPLFDKAHDGKDSNITPGFLIKDGVLMRRCPPRTTVPNEHVWQVVVPSSLRQLSLKTAHEDAGHMLMKTHDLVLRYCYWSRVKRDVAYHVKTCHTCQLTGKPNQMPKPVPLRPIVSASKPFEHIVIDCVGPLPRSKTGCLYLLTVICQTTRYPAAYPLRSITAKSVVKALSQFISIFGLDQRSGSIQTNALECVAPTDGGGGVWRVGFC